MLARINRFHGHNSVRRTYRHGKPVRSSLFSLHTLSGPRVKSSKVAIVVSKKVHKSAVKRNRIRRRLYVAVRPKLAEIEKPTEIVITVYKEDVAELPFGEIIREIDNSFKKAGL